MPLRSRALFFTLSFLLLSIVPSLLFAVPASDPRALALAQRAMSAMTQGATIQDLTLTGAATRSLGSSEEENGTVTLRALGLGESRMDLELSSGSRSEIRDDSTGTPQGKWILADGTRGLFAPHNCWIDAVWFFPALGSLSAGRNVVLSYIGREERNGTTVEHIQSHIYQTGQNAPDGPQQLSLTDFYLDPGTSLPVSISFKTHADDDVNIELPIEIQFDKYQLMGGVLVPSHIRQIGSVSLDIDVSSAEFNSGLSTSLFSIQ